MANILVVDDEFEFREGLIETLSDLGHNAIGAGSTAEAMGLLKKTQFQIIFVDFRMPNTNGVETIKLIQTELGERTPPIIMLTAFTDSANMISAMSLGAFDHLDKPVSRNEIQNVVTRALKTVADENRIASSVENLKPSASAFIGRSEVMRTVLKMVGRVSNSDSSVLITGETGTGKEVIARAIHDNSGRRHAPFVAINCAAIPENLLESELFGHVKGAFTGAVFEKKGLFQSAEGGTLLLDEIGDLDLALQSKILRALQEREISPVGGNRPIKVDVRILAATHRNLRDLVAEEIFREDLYYRLNVIHIHLPPLRTRNGDIVELSRHFLSMRTGPRKTLTAHALAKLGSYSWPGNIRELRNVLERAAVLTPNCSIDDMDIHFDAIEKDQPASEIRRWHSSVAELERSLLNEALAASGGNRSEAARRLGIQRQLLYAKLKEHQIEII